MVQIGRKWLWLHQGGGGGITNLPENGTAYLGAAANDSIKVSSANGAAFGLVSVDLAELSTTKYANGPVTVLFAGYYPNGSFVTTRFTTDGLIVGDGIFPDFQTFYFDSRFTGLQRVEIPTGGWWLDNLVVAVPEPSSLVLFGLGGLFAAARLLHQRRSKR
ncbi:MAG: PEP-CTERM sorting domain-containing protein [Limisphaerales bacterium]